MSNDTKLSLRAVNLAQMTAVEVLLEQAKNACEPILDILADVNDPSANPEQAAEARTKLSALLYRISHVIDVIDKLDASLKVPQRQPAKNLIVL